MRRLLPSPGWSLAGVLALCSVAWAGCGTRPRSTTGAPPVDHQHRRGDSPASSPVTGRAGGDPGAATGQAPFEQLPVVAGPDQLPPLRSVRDRSARESQDRSRAGRVRVRVQTEPRRARVYYGGRLLGVTPFTLKARTGSTPLDVVIRRRGYMTLRTRIRRKVSRTYEFKLTPAKIR